MSSTYAEDDARLIFQPIDQAVVPPGGIIEHLKDRWWIVHPTKGLVWYIANRRDRSLERASPQCNSNELISRRFSDAYPWAEIRFMPSVFRRINPHDY
jgi:hypothetical protein